jgi:hypothetical protein
LKNRRHSAAASGDAGGSRDHAGGRWSSTMFRKFGDVFQNRGFVRKARSEELEPQTTQMDALEPFCVLCGSNIYLQRARQGPTQVGKNASANLRIAVLRQLIEPASGGARPEQRCIASGRSTRRRCATLTRSA